MPRPNFPVMPANSSAIASYLVPLVSEDDYDGWRDAARRLAAAGVSPGAIDWQVGAAGGSLFADPGQPLPEEPNGELRVPRAFPALAQTALLHSDPERFALLYTLLLRLHREPGLLEDAADPLVRRVEGLARVVRRDIHKMRAFVRFREITEGDGTPRFVAWFEPEHHIVRANAGFFVRRFAAMRWSILTPRLSIDWDGETLREGPGADRSQAPAEDAVEDMWKAYYAAIFNPARLKIDAMAREMPRKYWKNLPEAQLIAPLIAGAQARESGMIARRSQVAGHGAANLAALAEEAQACRRCPLWRDATQCVFGEGPPQASLMIVGEQPGDEEDLAGRPFVGPAGRVLTRALGDAGLDRNAVYVTNAVKHFKFVLRGKRRLHQSPTSGEIEACRWWLDQEIALVRPRSVLMLGASAVRGVTGRAGSVGRMRGTPVPIGADGGDAVQALATWHPAFILRQPDRDASARSYDELVEDLRRADELARPA